MSSAATYMDPLPAAAEIINESPPAKPIKILQTAEGKTINEQSLYASTKPHQPDLAQIEAFEALKHLRSRLLCLTGGPGAGKTFWISVLCKWLMLLDKKCLVVGTNGSVTEIAAMKVADQVGLDKVIRYGTPTYEACNNSDVELVTSLTVEATMARKAHFETENTLSGQSSDPGKQQEQPTESRSGDAEQVQSHQTTELRQECLKAANIIVCTIQDCASEELREVYQPEVIIIENCGQALPEHARPLFRAYAQTAEAFIAVGVPEIGYLISEEEWDEMEAAGVEPYKGKSELKLMLEHGAVQHKLVGNHRRNPGFQQQLLEMFGDSGMW